MHALSQSPFLQALGYAIANSLWQVAVLWIVVVLLNGVFKFSSPAKYKIALYAQFAGFIWFIITLQFYYTQCSEVIAQTQALNGFGGSSYTQIQSTDFQSYLLNGIIKAERLLPFLSLAYLFLLVFLSAKWMRSYRFAQSIKTEGLQKPGVHWKLFVRKISSLLNIKSEVKIYLSELVKSPLTVGFLKPIILIPVASINHLTTEQLEAVILHELAHIKRADYLINLFQSVIEMALFFNPFTQLLSRIIKKERENSCDDWVLQFQYNPTMYAEALLRIAYLQTQPALVMHAVGTKSDLLSRVKRMIDKKEKTFNYRQQLIALLLMTGILSSVAWLQPSAKKNMALENTSAQTITQKTTEPAIIKDDENQNPFFNLTSFIFSKPVKEEINKAMVDAVKSVDDAKPDFNNAKIEFAKMLPAALCELKKLNADENIKIVFDNVKDSLQNALSNEDIALQKMNTADMVDTATIALSLKSAYDRMKEIDFQKIIKDGLEKAKEQMMLAQKDENMQMATEMQAKKDISKALKIMTDKRLMAAPPPPPVVPELLFKNKLNNEKLEIELDEIKKMEQRTDSLSTSSAGDDDNSPQNVSNQSWSYSYPVYIEKGDDNNAPKSFAYNVVDNETDSALSMQKVICIKANRKSHSKNSSFSSSHEPTVRIIKTEDGKSVNVTIEL